MKYSFRFQSLLELRKHQEKAEKQKLAEITKELMDLLNAREQIQRMIVEYALDNSDRGPGSVQFFKAGYTFLQQQRNKLRRLETKLRKIKAEQDKQRERLRLANQETKKLEKIKEKDKAKFFLEQERNEQLELNEIATQMYSRLND